MGLLSPEVGLVFWMSLAFILVFIIAAKIAFPMILKSMNKRKEYIDSSLDAARVAEKQLVTLQSDKEAVVAAAQNEKVAILKEAAETRDKMIAKARQDAAAEGSRIIAEAKAQAEVEKEEMLKEARSRIALLSVKVAEKILRETLSDEAAQEELAGKLMDEMESDNK